MTAPEFNELSRLWQDQVGTAEEATLRGLATDIERTALRRRGIDFLMAAVAIILVLLVLFTHALAVPARLALAAAIGILLWTIWVRQRFLERARALSCCDPKDFFTTAIQHARAELAYSTFSLWAAAPLALTIFAMLQASRGLGSSDLLVREMLQPHGRKTLAMIGILAVGYMLFIRANFRLREQVKRLEAMNREWEREDSVEGRQAN